MGILGTIALAIWIMLPAYVPNNIAAVAGGGPPIDAGRTWRGRRLLGDGKTWRGTVAGILAGTLLAVVLTTIATNVRSLSGIEVVGFPLTVAFTLPTGALLGDIAASFCKRRLDRTRGAPFPVLDQLDFVIGALALTALVDPAWTLAHFTLPILAVVLLLTPILHVTTNVIGYYAGIKRDPW